MAFDVRTWSRTAALLIGAACAPFGCGGFVESGGGVTRLTVGAEGGTLATTGFALVVPPHALMATVTLSVHRAAVDAPAGSAFTVESAEHVSFDSMTPGEVTLDYDAAVHAHPGDVFVAVAATDGWHALTRPAGDPGTAGLARSATTTLGTFGVLDCPGGVCATSDGGAPDATAHD
jgi:hypothetical protein